MEKNHRREFLKKSVLGLSGAALLPSVVRHDMFSGQGQSDRPDLPVRAFGRTGIKTPLISLGAGNSNDAGFIKACYHAGIKLFFSATYYGEGNNERLAGTALKGLPRDTFVVGTAVTPDGFDTDKGRFQTSMNVDAFVKKAEESLKRFGLDYVDILLFPYAGKRDTMLNPALLKAMSQLKKSGKTKFVGVATHDNSPEALRAAADSKVYDVVMAAYNHRVENKENFDDAIAYAVKAGVGVMAMKTLAGVHDNKAGGQTVSTDAAIKWALRNENISTVVSGMSSLEELNRNMELIKDIRLNDKELKELSSVDGMKGNSLWCRQCQNCVPQCPRQLSIPTIMRSYMYAYGYGNMEHSHHTLISAGVAGNPCSGCQSCSVACSQGFNVRERIADISRLSTVPAEFLKA